MIRILSVSYDQALLSSRQLLLESLGCEVVSASDLGHALQLCNHASPFDLFVLGHSIPGPDKESLVVAFRTHSSAPVIALKRFGEEPISSVDFEIEPEPGQLLQVISSLLSGHAASA
jgi:CheY-like chemotaxis protein